MCGIVGFIGRKPAAPLLLEGLSKLEYRGYDSAGIALVGEKGIEIYKSKGRLQILRDKIQDGKDLPQTVGIGHTRWATHGKPSDENSHPHQSNDGNFAVVHNGIIENYAGLKKELQAEGFTFLSETDTEVVAHLLQKYYKGDFMLAVRQTVARLEGAYALGILCADFPNQIIAVRRASPLIVGLSQDANFIASDIPAVLSHTRRFLQLEDGEMARLTSGGVELFDADGRLVEKQELKVSWDVDSAEKGGYAHFMIKEIMEQPDVIRKTVSPRLKDGKVVLDGVKLTEEQLRKLKKLYIVACGSAYHVGMVGKYVIEKMTRIPVEVDLSSEFRYRDPIVDKDSLVVIISQSGETADTLEALKNAKAKGARILSIVNVVGSSIARESEDVLYTWAGPEICVATTKAYSTQLAMMYILAAYIAQTLQTVPQAQLDAFLDDLLRLPEQIAEVLKLAPKLQQMAQRYAYLEHAYYIGRNVDYAVSLEASLKLKEISYIHSEAYAAGELKHGPISLIEDGTFVVGLACCERLAEKMLSNVKEVKARGAEVLVVTNDHVKVHADEADHILLVPYTNEMMSGSLEVVVMQMLAYYIALARKCDIDKPRNLAKSVTVE
ncbi:MAG: glutamine--fructose-6-phosphate transaminase (isomerizing) [Clostridia bacterium]|nr:glutamine--fructose-6-phosphate transaminase (isomerizing) [Clostridia bacterium]